MTTSEKPPRGPQDQSESNEGSDVVSQLTSIADAMTLLLERMIKVQQSRDDTAVSLLRSELKTVRDSIKVLNRILQEGNGQLPLIARVAVLENEVADIKVDEATRREEKKISRKGRYTIGAALISGVVALVTSVLSLLAGG